MILGLGDLNRHVNLGEQDTPAYLSKSLAIREEGGLSGFIRACVTGAYPNEYRHPLYMLALAPLAERDLSFFPRAKLASLLFGLAAICATYWAARRAFGREAATIAAALLAINKQFVSLSSMVACESLMVLFFVLAWGEIPRDDGRARHSLLGGAWAGLAYMVKATGLILVWSFLVMAFGRWRHRAFVRRDMWLFVLGFVIVTWPLLVRNTVVHRNPLHNANSNVIWLDNWEQWYSPEFKENPPSALQYWRTHTLKQMAQRMGFGLRHEAEMFQVECLRPVGVPDAAATIFTGVVLLAALAGLFGSGFSWRALLSVFLLIVFFLAFSWHFVVVPHPRFMMPLVPVVYAYSAAAVVAWLRRIKRRDAAVDPERAAEAVVVGVVTALLLWQVSFDPSIRRNPMQSYRLRPGYHEQRRHLETLPETATYLMGPAHGYDFNWHSRIRARRLEVPLVKDFKSLETFIRRERVSHIVLNPESVFRRRASLGGFFWLRGGQGIVTKRVPEGWRIALADAEPPVDYLIFDVSK